MISSCCPQKRRAHDNNYLRRAANKVRLIITFGYRRRSIAFDFVLLGPELQSSRGPFNSQYQSTWHRANALVPVVAEISERSLVRLASSDARRRPMQSSPGTYGNRQTCIFGRN